MNQRIEIAWQKCKGWITEYDGAATEDFLPDISSTILAQAFNVLARQTANLRTNPLWDNDVDEEFIEGKTSLDEQLSLLISGEIVSLSVMYVTRLDDFDFSVHIIADINNNRQVDFELIWWSDEVFPNEADKERRFNCVLKHFIDLQSLFRSEHLFIGSENLERPSPQSKMWIEV